MDRGTVAAGLGVVCILGLAACSSPFAGDRVRERWVDRVRLDSCGEVVLDQGVALRQAGGSALDCLRDALRSGSGAELRVEQPTTEGDPVISYVRVTPDGAAEVYVDSTRDGFGDQKWSFTRCARPRSVLDVDC